MSFRLVCHQGWKVDGANGNSLEAFQQAKSHGYNAIECDTRLTSDNVVVLSHDDAVNGCTISTSTYAEVLSSVPYILKFDDLVDWCIANNMYIYIDVKDWHTRSYIASTLTEKNAVGIVSVYNMYSSDLENARYGSLQSAYTGTLDERCKTSSYFVCVNANIWTTEQVNAYADDGYNVEVYTINDVSKAREFLEAGAIGITTDSVTYADLGFNTYYNVHGDAVQSAYDLNGNLL